MHDPGNAGMPAPLPTWAAASGGPVAKARLVGIAMVGNEADIVESFVRENCEFLDHLLIADHNSLDGTREILADLVAEGLPITVERIQDVAYAQGKVTNQLLRAAMARFSPDWILPIDADEFLDAPDRSVLEEELLGLAESHGLLAWVTQVPTDRDDAAELHPLKRITHRYAYPTPPRDQNPWVWKMVVNARMLAPYLDRYELEKGNHRLVFIGTKEPTHQPVCPLQAVRLRHVPVRSYDQLAAKIGIGRAQTAFSANKIERAGFHWSPIYQGILEGRSDVTLLQGACRQYLDLGRRNAEETADTPTVVDPMRVRHDLRLVRHRVPVPALFVRWFERHLPDARPTTATTGSQEPRGDSK